MQAPVSGRLPLRLPRNLAASPAALRAGATSICGRRSILDDAWRCRPAQRPSLSATVTAAASAGGSQQGGGGEDLSTSGFGHADRVGEFKARGGRRSTEGWRAVHAGRAGGRRSRSTTRSSATFAMPVNMRSPRRRAVNLARRGSSSRARHTSINGGASKHDEGYGDGRRHGQGGSSGPFLGRDEVAVLSGQVQAMLRAQEIRGELEALLGGGAEGGGITGHGREPTHMEWAAAAGMSEDALRRVIWTGRQAQKRLVDSNVRLVMKVAHRYGRQGHGSHGLSMEDLIQEGCMGLIHGVERYDASRGVNLSTYVYHWIRLAVQQAVVKSGRSIKLPFHVDRLQEQIRRSTSSLYTSLGRLPDDVEVANSLGIKESRVREVRRWSLTLASLEATVGKGPEGEGRSLADTISIDDSTADCQAAVEHTLLQMDLDDILDTLQPRDGRIIRQRFGLEDGERKTLAEVARGMQCTSETVRKGQIRALQQLRHPRRSEVLRAYVADL